MDRNELELKNKGDLIAMGESLGMKLTPAMTKGDMIDSLLGIPVVEKTEAALPAIGQLRDLNGDLVVSTGKVRVTIMATDSERGDVFLGLNGHGLQIKRGIPVVIPAEYLNVLRDSVIQTTVKNPETNRMEPQTIMRYPFTAEPA